MSFSGKAASAFMLSNGQALYWPYLKLKILKKIYDDPYGFFQVKISDDLTEINVLKGCIKLEFITTTVMYAEVLASNLLARKESKIFHEPLLNYPVENIIQFYNEIDTFDANYLCTLLQYPPLEQMGEDLKEKCMKSGLSFKDKLLKIKDYYLKYRGLYNSYKHGLRVTVNEINGGTEDEDILITYFNDKHNIDKINLIKIENINEEIKLCSYIEKILIAVNESHSERIISNKKEFQITLFEDVK
jgi:hypothetical protein